MNSTINTLLSHRSIRSFTEQPIDSSLLDTILDCGLAASSSSFIQCVSVVRVSTAEKRIKLAEYAGGQPYVESCSEFLVFCADYNRHQQIHPEAQLGFTEQTLIGSIDAAMMAQNCLTAAESVGLGGVYIGGLRNNPQKVTELLALPKHVIPLFGLCLGYPNQNPETKPRLPKSIVVHQEQYQPISLDELAQYDAHIQDYYATRTDNKKAVSWSTQITQTLSKEARPFMHDFLQKQGFNTK
ncbi:oxygen-insensitive NADPH nitroreductase [Vibrio breoganii]|uniref:oxygen-insensitive NADPH nitroreductase n=1 Tax=Vibrio breoganii TaxID=553239 RepID=UPI0003165D75|nr:oxygen-insensitive NADPH nitroreductase [Vibrio breoganii]OED97282.1 nitroreductase A [Vibrio breoganii ZF-29]PMK20717.1 nitroreductase A [Vibrio breoganii]PMK77708.1 nitroreductase A [Vibrio breoganii]PML64192.1 nitroreductase A [Vibrio breoganii]PMM20370.1 nitroreductase A [Vibrio breoganii]